MHSYYRKNLKKYEKDIRKSFKLIKAEIEENFDKPYNEIVDEIWFVFSEDMLENFPYIGNLGNVSNLIKGYTLISFGVVCRNHGINIEKWGLLASTVVERLVGKVPRPIRFIIRKIIRLPYIREKFLPKQCRISEENAEKNPKAFISQMGQETDQHFLVYNYIQCPLNEFAKEYGYTEFMPYICNTDYVSAHKFGIPLERFKTCSKGDECCDFRIKTTGKPHPYWPTHILDDNDPLN